MGTLIGLDVSTSCVGVAVATDGTTTTHHVRLDNVPDFYDKLDAVIRDLELVGSDITRVWVEEPVLSFRQGFSSAGTIALLQRFNGAVCGTVHRATGVRPTHVPVATARKLAGYRSVKDRSAPKVPEKKRVFEWALANYPGVFEWETAARAALAASPAWAHKGIKPRWYDEVDAFVVLLAGVLQDRINTGLRGYRFMGLCTPHPILSGS